MKTIIFLSLFGCVALVSPAVILTPVVPTLSSQYHSQDVLGQYSYGYANGLSAKSEVRTADGVTRGGYSYIDPEGKLQSIEYSADSANGFRAVGTNIPSVPQPVVQLQQPVQVVDTPEVAEAKAKHLAAVEEAKTRAVVQPQPTVTAPVLPGFVQQLPASVSFRTDLIPGGNSIAHFVPAFSYSYGVPSTYFTAQPFVTTYTAPVVFSNVVHSQHSADSQPADSSNERSATTNETGDIAGAEADHAVDAESDKSNQE